MSTPTKTKKTGSRMEVWDGTALKTKGGLTKDNLAMNAKGRIVSKRKQELGRLAFSMNLLKSKSSGELESIKPESSPLRVLIPRLGGLPKPSRRKKTLKIVKKKRVRKNLPVSESLDT